MSLPEEGILKGAAIVTGTIKADNPIDTSGVASMCLDGSVMESHYDRMKEETRIFDFTAPALLPRKHVTNSHWHRHTFERPRRKGRR